MATRAAIRREIHDRLHAGTRTFRRLRNGPDATSLTEYTSSMASVTDTALKEVGSFPSQFQGAWIRNKYVDDASAVQERVSRIHQFDPSNGVLTFSPAIGNVNGTAADVNGEYEVWPNLHPDEADNAINRTLQAIPYEAFLPVTLIDDGDMEDAGTTAWTQVSNATPSKVSSPLPYGRQALRVLTNISNAGIRSALVPAQPDEPFYFSVFFQMTAVQTWTISLQRGAAVETLKSAVVSDIVPLEVRFTAYGNASTTSVGVQATAASGGATADFGFVSLRSGWRRHYKVDSSSLTGSERAFELYRLPAGQATETANVYAPFTHPFQPAAFDVLTRERDGSPNTILVPDTPDPLFVRAIKTFPTVSADATDVVADKELVVNGALSYLWDTLGEPQKAAQARRTFNALLDNLGHGLRLVQSTGHRVLVPMG